MTAAPWSFRVHEVRRRTTRRRVAFAVFALIDVAVVVLLYFQANLLWALVYVAVSTAIFARVVMNLEERDYTVDRSPITGDDLPVDPSKSQGPELS